MSALHVRPGRLDDLNAIVALDHLCFGKLWTLDQYAREIESPNSDLLIITPQEQPACLLAYGCVWRVLDEAHVTLIAVNPDHHRQGLGKLTLWALLTAARQQQMARATLEVRVSNQGAIALYESFGFQEAGRRKRYYEDTGEDALILWRGGLQTPPFQGFLQDCYRAIAQRLSPCWQCINVTFDTILPDECA
ncbi:MAG: ribosomal protein S18-alanine N-acetyltransferase [Synechococcales bacterium]|nr:ribosomal protein S18-alanine N-acetyltransferase [Synechococcales bacterium]